MEKNDSVFIFIYSGFFDADFLSKFFLSHSVLNSECFDLVTSCHAHLSCVLIIPQFFKKSRKNVLTSYYCCAILLVSQKIPKEVRKRMNKAFLESVMKLNSDTQADLAEYLGISLSRLNAKINEYRGAQFFQTEIAAIKKRYALTEQQVDTIFFGGKVS